MVAGHLVVMHKLVRRGPGRSVSELALGDEPKFRHRTALDAPTRPQPVPARLACQGFIGAGGVYHGKSGVDYTELGGGFGWRGCGTGSPLTLPNLLMAPGS